MKSCGQRFLPRPFEELTVEIYAAVRDQCDYLVPAGWDHNCYTEGPEGIGFRTAYPQDGPGDCVGSCSYAGNNCGEPPELYGDGETGNIEDPDGQDTDGVDGVDRTVKSPQGSL